LLVAIIAEVVYLKSFTKKEYNSKCEEYDVIDIKKMLDDDGFILLGKKNEVHDVNKYSEKEFIAMLDNNMDVVWKKYNDDKLSGNVNMECVAVLPGGNFMVGGIKDYEDGTESVTIIKIDKRGDKLWERIYPVKDMFVKVKGIKPFGENKFLVTGDIFYGPYGGNIFAMCVDTAGKMLWKKVYEEKNYLCEGEVLDFQVRDDKCVILDLVTGKNGCNAEKWKILEIDNNGNVLWEKVENGAEEAKMWFNDDSTFVVASLDVFHNYNNVMLTKYKLGGEKIWRKYYNFDVRVLGVKAVYYKNGKYVVAVSVVNEENEPALNWATAVVCFDENGNAVANVNTGIGPVKDYCKAIETMIDVADNEMLIVGRRLLCYRGYCRHNSIWTVKLNTNTCKLENEKIIGFKF